MKTKRIHFYFLAAVLSIQLSSSALAQLTKLNVGYSAISEEELPAWLGKESGIFEKNGLDVQLIYLPAEQRLSRRSSLARFLLVRSQVRQW
jgi:ABC-type nitrate/sulfonate/bicarbonate transport system substrate-binding protein